MKNWIICEKYVIKEILHQTESNSVFLVEHTVLGNLRIVKKMKKEQNFQLEEIEILKQLSHPNIPKIIDVMEDEEYRYLIREFADGKNLEEWMEEKGKPEEAEIREIALQLAEALDYLHRGLEKPIVYRDLKPENVIINEKNHISLIDFGIARFATDSRKKDTMFLGTKAYAAPEQFGILCSDEKSDIYAYGMTLYYLLGKHTITQMPYKRMEEERWQNEYSEDLIKLIYACSEPQREKRPEDFQEIRQRLKRDKIQEAPIFFPEKSQIYMGIRSGVGTSFITYWQAQKRAEQGERVALLDWSESQQICKLSYVCKDVITKKASFIIGNVEIFPLSGERRIPGNWQDYDSILIDYGVFTGEKKNETKEHMEKLILVCGGALWDMFDLDEVIFNYRLIDYRFLLNQASQTRYETLKEEYPDLNVTMFSDNGSNQQEVSNHISRGKSYYKERFQAWRKKLTFPLKG